MPADATILTEADILTDVVAPDQADFSPEFARAIVQLKFRQKAIDRMNELAEKNRQGVLTEPEQIELERFLRVGNFLNLMQAKARKSITSS